MEDLERALLALLRGAQVRDCAPVARALGLAGGECPEDGACERCCALAAEALASRAGGVVRCRECAHCREFPQGSVCTVRGAAGWFATDPRGYCHRAARRVAAPGPSERPARGGEGGAAASTNRGKDGAR